MASSTNTTDFGATLSAAIAGGYVAQLNGGTYTVTQPIVININSTIQGALGINGGGATINSEITNGQPVIEIVVGPGVDLRYLDLSNFNIVGNGAEGDGIKIIADGNDRWAYNWNINNVNVSHVGGYGLDMQGSIFEGLVSNSSFNNNGEGGAYIGNSADGGVASAQHWFGGSLDNNNGAGLTLGDGARDISVDGVTVANNNGAGIEAASGITSVTNSSFTGNNGAGIAYQVYGNFNDDTFTNTGAQTAGITGYTLGETTMVGDSSSGGQLANLTGSGSLLETGDSGSIATASSMTTGGAGTGDQVNVYAGTQGVTLPSLTPITSASVAAVADSAGTSGLDAVMHTAFASGTVEQVTSATSYTVSAPIVINVTSSAQAIGIDLGGAKIESDITNGAPVIEIVVAAGVTVGSLSLSNFSIFGNGSEGDGIRIVSNGSTQLNVTNVNVEHTGGIGLDVIGNVQGSVTDSWMNGNAQGGAQFANSPNGGVASNLQWVGGGFRLNGVAGLILQNGTHDMSVSGAYFVQNNGPGIDATSGITSVLGSGFENDTGSGAVVQGTSNFTDDTFSTYGPEVTAVGAYLTSGEQVTITGPDVEYYGSGADPMLVANMQGQGTLAIASAGNVIAGPSITVTGGNPVVDPPNLTTAWGGSSGSGSGSGNSSGSGLGSGSSGGTTNGPADPALTFTAGSISNGVVTLTGNTGQAGDQVDIYDGNDWVGVTTTDSTGAFTFTAAADGSVTNTYGGFVMDPSGAIWNSTATLVINPAVTATPPTVTEALAHDTGASATDHITSNDTLMGTADANAVVHFTVDGTAVTATATTNASGAWSFTPAGLADGQHTVVASETNAAGLTGAASLSFTLDTHAPSVTEAVASSGAPALTGTGDPNATVHFTVDGSAIAAMATANASGDWSYTPTGLANGQHTVVASETDTAGNTGSASVSFTLGAPHSPVPVFTGESIASGDVTLTGTTGQANDQVTIYDGNAWLGTATTNSSGVFTFVAAVNSNATNTYGDYATDPSGNIWHDTNQVIVGGAAATTLVGTTGDDFINANGANDTITGAANDQLAVGSGKTTVALYSAPASGPSAPATISGFQHGVDKIDFTSIAGITASGGVPQFQGNITGTGNLILNPHSVAYIEVGTHTDVLVNTTATAETVTTANTHAANMEIVLQGVHLGLTATDFHHA